MRKRDYLIISLLIIALFAVVLGINTLIKNAHIPSEITQIAKEDDVKNIYDNEITVETDSKEEKISPNCKFALKKYYDECSHFDYEEAELPIELVNLNEDEVNNYYADWEVDEFSSDNLVLCKEINGYCNQHFLIKLDDQNVNVYRLGTLGELNQYEETDISRDYLPIDDIEKLEEGIMIFGEGKLSSALEDYE